MPTYNKKVVAFDVDGTLADSFTVFVQVMQVLMRRTFTQQEIAELKNYSMREVITKLGVKKWQLPWIVVRGRREIDRRHNDITIFKGIPEQLQMLHNAGYTLNIVSSHSAKGIRLLLQQNGLSQYITTVYGNVGLFGKPQVLKKMQRQLGYAPDECVFVGDEVRDIEAAQAAGWRCVAVTWGFNSAERLGRNKPTALVDKPQDLSKVIIGR